MTTYTLGADGFFTSISGHLVIKEDVRPKLATIRKAQGKPGDGTTTYIGHPTGIIWHYTAGFQDDIAGTMFDHGYATAGFCVGREGAIRQYYPVTVAGWHAFQASQHYYGIEHTAFPPQTTATVSQLQASAALSAALVEFTKKHYGFSIPLQHKPTEPPPNLPAGFRSHIDGTPKDWNPPPGTTGVGQHTDQLLKWTWDKYLDEVESHLVAPPSTTYKVSVNSKSLGTFKRERVAFRKARRALHGLTKGSVHVHKDEG